MSIIGERLMRLGADRVAPGIYTFGDEMHVDAEELLLTNGLEPTPARIAALERGAVRVGDDLAIAIESVEWRGPSGGWRNG